jgi:DNA polymerase-3 subunit delta'
VLGQPRAIDALRRSLRGGFVHHAWILHGPFGVGKHTTALAFARLILDPETTAEHVARFEPPAGTRVAELIDSGTHPDLHLISKESTEDSTISSLRERKQTNIPVDLLRERMIGGEVDGRSFDGPIWRSAYLGRGKVFIVDEAELLDAVGQNALLKTLEEPPPATYIMLVTTREDRLLPTIRSRCQRVAFGPLPPDAMDAWLERSGVAARIESDATRRWLLDFAEGSPGQLELALRHGVHEWFATLRGDLEALDAGRFPPGCADRCAEIVTGCAESIVKEQPRASKEAANRLATRLLLALFGERVRRGLREAAASDDIEDAERWAALADLLAGADEEIRRNLNLKQILANLVAQWSLRASARAGTP